MHISWEDLQTLEALVRTGSVEAAGRELTLRHSTVSRRIAALEGRLGATLFARGARLVPTALAQRIAEDAGAMHSAAGQIQMFVGAERRRREHTVVITTSDVLSPLLCAAVARARLAHAVEILVTDDELELLPGQVDLALRPSQSPRGSLRGRRLGRLRIGIYRAPGAPATWVLPGAALRAKTSMRWWRHVPETAPGAIVCSSLLAMRDACRFGLGRAALPSALAHEDERLRLDDELDGGPPLWLLAPVGSAAGTKVRDVKESLATALRNVGEVFAE
ncbi:MAG: LysR family transcriptional regulator [Deltaproteobacteria bacterium]|nr:LysR family transcriptional regulator [Deltaproteobacteria bacterium]